MKLNFKIRKWLNIYSSLFLSFIYSCFVASYTLILFIFLNTFRCSFVWNNLQQHVVLLDEVKTVGLMRNYRGQKKTEVKFMVGTNYIMAEVGCGDASEGDC